MKKLAQTIAIFSFGLIAIPVKSQIITTIAGNGNAGFSGDGGPLAQAEFNYVAGIKYDASGNLFIADELNSRVRKVNTSGIITTIAGNGAVGYTGNGGQATSAELDGPIGVSVGHSGNIYISDEVNNVIRMVNTSGIITTVAGNGYNAGVGSGGFSGDGGYATAAELNLPVNTAIDASGNLYICDWHNQRIRKVNTSGIISTVAGNGISGYAGDGGTATAAELDNPNGITVDVSGNIIIAEGGLSSVIRKVNTSGNISTIAGIGSAGFSGDGGAATSSELYFPSDVAYDASGNLYIVDDNNNRIRQINSAGIINTFAGNGTAGFSGDGSAATAAELNYPYSLCFDPSGNLVIGDVQNERLRKVGGSLGVESLSKDDEINVYPTPATKFLHIDLIHIQGNVLVTMYNLTGKEIVSESFTNPPISLNVISIPTGVYILKIRTDYGKSFLKKIIVTR